MLQITHPARVLRSLNSQLEGCHFGHFSILLIQCIHRHHYFIMPILQGHFWLGAVLTYRLLFGSNPVALELKKNVVFCWWNEIFFSLRQYFLRFYCQHIDCVTSVTTYATQ